MIFPTQLDLDPPGICFEFIPFHSDLDPIMTPWYLDRDTKFKNENIFCLSESYKKHGIPDKFMASWALARLNYLFGDRLLEALNTVLDSDENHIGCQDAGYFYANGYVKSDKNEIIGHISLEGSSGYIELNLMACSDEYFPDEIMDKLFALIWSAPFDMKPCHIIIKDPEQNSKAFHYGWDGAEYYYTTFE